MNNIKMLPLFILTSILCVRVIVLIHEIIGHYLMARILGVHIRYLYCTVFGGAFMRTDLENDPHYFGALITFAGPIIQLVSGILVTLLAFKLNKKTLIGFLLFVFGYIAVNHFFFYFALNVYYGTGDFWYFNTILSNSQRQVLVTLIGGVIVVTAYLLTKKCASILGCLFHQKSRLGLFLSILICWFVAYYTSYSLAALEGHFFGHLVGTYKEASSSAISPVLTFSSAAQFLLHSHVSSRDMLGKFLEIMMCVGTLLGIWRGLGDEATITPSLLRWHQIAVMAGICAVLLFAAPLISFK